MYRRTRDSGTTLRSACSTTSWPAAIRARVHPRARVRSASPRSPPRVDRVPHQPGVRPGGGYRPRLARRGQGRVPGRRQADAAGGSGRTPWTRARTAPRRLAKLTNVQQQWAGTVNRLVQRQPRAESASARHRSRQHRDPRPTPAIQRHTKRRYGGSFIKDGRIEDPGTIAENPQALAAYNAWLQDPAIVNANESRFRTWGFGELDVAVREQLQPGQAADEPRGFARPPRWPPPLAS